jgi:DNA polymerase I-like protein with 3'-5' exonuclease and polymerase domains
MIVFDIEADGLLEDATKIHCLSYRDPNGGSVVSTSDYNDMRNILLKAKGLIGHNIIRYDIPLLEKILDIKIKAQLFDTLPMSWVINYNRSRHGLDTFGEDFGIPKPVITDWHNLTTEEYIHRCQEDVKINCKLWQDLIKRFMFIYKDKTELNRFFRYLQFKMDCAKEAEHQGWKLDVQKAQGLVQQLTDLQDHKTQELVDVMPMRKIMAVKSKPKSCYKKDGSLSSQGKKWADLLDGEGLPHDYEGEVTVVKGVEAANPMSSDQVKDWLFGLGWKPCTFKYVGERKIPQVRVYGELTKSVKILMDDNKQVQVLDGLTVLQHRLGILKGFLECQRDGYVKAEIAGLTNTLRFKHQKPLVNLPGVDKPWGMEIRGCLTAPDGYLLCGADMTSLEDTTKRHYMHSYDPDYVAEMSQPGFDPHLDLARHAGYATQEEIDKYNRGDMPKLKELRKNFKVVNYSATYGIGAPKLSRETDMSEKQAKDLLDAYWNRNWSVKKFCEDQEPRKINQDMWIQNPVSKFWHSLRFKKDAFSTINQSTGAYCFDRWVALYRSKRSNIIGQFHDESINVIKKGEENEHTSALQWAIEKLNEQLRLNVDLGIDIQYGQTYADVH